MMTESGPPPDPSEKGLFSSFVQDPETAAALLHIQDGSVHDSAQLQSFVEALRQEIKARAEAAVLPPEQEVTITLRDFRDAHNSPEYRNAWGTLINNLCNDPNPPARHEIPPGGYRRVVSGKISHLLAWSRSRTQRGRPPSKVTVILEKIGQTKLESGANRGEA